MDVVTVNVVVHDTECAAYMHRVSVQVLFLCTHCAHASRTLPGLIEHLHTCEAPPPDVTTSKLHTDHTGGFNIVSNTSHEQGMIGTIQPLTGNVCSSRNGFAEAEDPLTVVSNEHSLVESMTASRDDLSFDIHHQDIDAKLNALIELLNEVKHPESAKIPQIQVFGTIASVDQSESESKCVHVELVKDPALKTELQDISEKCRTVDKAVDELNVDCDDLSAPFHDDLDNDPDFIPSSKSKSRDLKTLATFSEESSDNSFESDVDDFIKQYEEFVAKSVDDLFRQNSSKDIDCGTKGTKSNLPDIVEDKHGNFDFATDIKAVLQVPGLTPHQFPAKSWRCIECPDEELLSSTDLDLHMKCHGDEVKGKFKCHLCKRRSATLKNHLTAWPTMRTHLASVHDIDFQIRCNNCDHTVSSLEQLALHRTKFHKLSCKYGNSSVKLGKSATKHSLITKEIAKSEVETASKMKVKRAPCRFTCFERAELALHERCHDPADPADPGALRCPVCHYVGGKKRGRYLQIRQHIEAEHQHLLTQKYTCPGCREGFHTESVYKQHYYACANIQHLHHRCMFCTRDNSHPVVAIHDHLANDRKLYGFKEKVRKAMKLLQEGKSMHEVYSELLVRITGGEGVSKGAEFGGTEAESQVYKCSLCYKKLKTKTSFERHMFKCHPEGSDETVCQACGKLFRTKNQYRNHYIQVHQGVKRKHVHRIKENPKPKQPALLKCSQCEYTSPHQTRVRNHHMSVHMGILPYKCKKCDYATNEVSDLRRHENKHLGVKRYACSQCDYKASHHWLLAAHCKRQHDVQLPRKRNTFNFMGTEGSMRWQRKREKERDLQRRMTSVYPPPIVPDVTNFQQVLESINVQDLGGDLTSAELTASKIINSVASDQDQLNVLVENTEARVMDSEHMLSVVEESGQGSVLTEQGADQIQYVMRENTENNANVERVVYVNSQEPVSIANTNQPQTVFLFVNT